MLYDTLRLVGAEDTGWRIEFLDAFGALVLVSVKFYASYSEALADLRILSGCVRLFD